MPKRHSYDAAEPPPPRPVGHSSDPLVTVETQREQDLFSGRLAERTFVKLYVAARESGLLAAISDRDWKTLCTLATYMDGDGYCYPSQAELARAMGCSRQMANERIKSLASFRFNGQQVLLVVKEGRTEKGEWAKNGYRVLPISRLRIYDAPASQADSDSANDSLAEAESTVSRNLDTVAESEPTVSSPTVTVPLDTNKNQRKQDLDPSKFEGSHDQMGAEDTEEAHQRSIVSDTKGDDRRGRGSSETGLESLGAIVGRRAADPFRTGAAADSAIAGIAPGPPVAPPARRARASEYSEERERLRPFLADFARELGDEAPLASTITRTLKIFKTAGVPPERWPDALYQARGLTQEHTAQIRKVAGDGEMGTRRKNKMPYFLATLEQLVGLRPERPPQARGSNRAS
jgi:biotin operon repressor